MTIPTKTLGAVLYQPKEPLQVEELWLPELKPGQVLVDVAFSGLCHSQLLEVQGERGPDKFLPHALGHEASGVVLSVGHEVTKVAPGSRVVLSWIAGTGAAAPGPVYRNCRDEVVNAGPVATFLRHAIVSENRCYPLPTSLPLDIAALFGCALPTGCGLFWRKLRAKKGESLVILGAGGVGLSTLLAGSLEGCFPRIVVDIYPEKLALAKKLGATHTLLFDSEKIQSAVLELTRGVGADHVVEASGNIRAMESALALARARGGQVLLAGNIPAGERISIDPYALIYGRVLLGTAGGESVLSEDIEKLEGLYRNPHFPMEGLLGERFPIEKINTAMERLRTGALGRILISS